jgi:hypothetical protein
MLINFQLVYNRAITLSDLAERYSNADLCSALNNYVDYTRQMISGVSDEQAQHIPHDPNADDPYAASEAERHAGWSLIHIIMHVTASAEEAAAFSSILARGIPIGGRLRHETDWREVLTCAEVIERLEECQRICLGYLATWPDVPDLTTTRIMPEGMTWMKPNAPTQFLAGLLHWQAHIPQMRGLTEMALPSASLIEAH